MGSGVSVELEKPLDGSDLRSSGSLQVALNEVMRLRRSLGHLAEAAGFAAVVYDGSDLCLGMNDAEDFERCVLEVVHIRQCLQLSTQGSKRKNRGENYALNRSRFEEKCRDEELKEESDNSSSSDEDT